MIPTVAKAGRIKGIKICQNTLISEHPSILAASSNSLGIVLKKPVNIKTDNGIPVAVYIKIRDHKEFVSPKSFIKINRGTIPSLIGIINPMRKKKNRAPVQLNLNLAM